MTPYTSSERGMIFGVRVSTLSEREREREKEREREREIERERDRGINNSFFLLSNQVLHH